MALYYVSATSPYYVPANTHTCAHKYRHTCTRKHPCTHECISACTHTQAHAHTRARTHAHIYACPHTCVHTRAHTHMNTHTHTRMNTATNIRTCATTEPQHSMTQHIIYHHVTTDNVKELHACKSSHVLNMSSPKQSVALSRNRPVTVPSLSAQSSGCHALCRSSKSPATRNNHSHWALQLQRSTGLLTSSTPSFEHQVSDWRFGQPSFDKCRDDVVV